MVKRLLLLILPIVVVQSLCPKGYFYDSVDDICVPIMRYLASNVDVEEKGCPMCNLKPIVDQYEKYNRIKNKPPPRKPRVHKPNYMMDIFDLPKYAAELANMDEGDRKQVLSDLLQGLDWRNLPIVAVD